MVSVGWTFIWRRTSCCPMLLIEFLRAFAQCMDEVAVATAVGAQIRSDAEQRRKRGGLGKLPPMIVDIVFEPGIALRVGAFLTFKHDRLAVRE